MNRVSTLLWILVIAVAAFMLYMAKYQVQSLQTDVAQATRDLEDERQALRVASAEWAYLNRPERLRELAAKYLTSSAVTPSQVADIQEIPLATQTQASNDSEEGIQPVSVKIPKEAGAMR